MTFYMFSISGFFLGVSWTEFKFLLKLSLTRAERRTDGHLLYITYLYLD